MPTGTRAYIAMRERQLRRRFPEYRLGTDRRLELTAANNPLKTITLFPNRDQPLTIAMEITRDDAASNGILFEVGGSARGIAAYIDADGDLGFVAGASGDDGVTVHVSTILPTVGQVYRLTFAMLTGSGKARVWVDGQLVGRGQAVGGDFNGLWGAPNNGAIGAIEGTVSSRGPAGQQAALTDATIIGPVIFFDGVFPQHGDW